MHVPDIWNSHAMPLHSFVIPIHVTLFKESKSPGQFCINGLVVLKKWSSQMENPNLNLSPPPNRRVILFYEPFGYKMSHITVNKTI